MKVDRTAVVRDGVHFGSPSIAIAGGCFINRQCYLDGETDIVLEDHVHLAPGVRVLTAGHEIGPSKCRAGSDTRAPVRLGHGSWIGANATILPGVHVAAGCIVAAGAVVTRSTEPDGLYAGVPARRVRDLNSAGAEVSAPRA